METEQKVTLNSEPLFWSVYSLTPSGQLAGHSAGSFTREPQGTKETVGVADEEELVEDVVVVVVVIVVVLVVEEAVEVVDVVDVIEVVVGGLVVGEFWPTCGSFDASLCEIIEKESLEAGKATEGFKKLPPPELPFPWICCEMLPRRDSDIWSNVIALSCSNNAAAASDSAKLKAGQTSGKMSGSVSLA